MATPVLTQPRAQALAWEESRAHPNLVLLVLPGVREARNDSGDTDRGRDLAGVYHDQQLHEVVVDLSRPALHDVDIFPTH